jgi:outer membrane PBP1 activator LpoA protein
MAVSPQPTGSGAGQAAVQGPADERAIAPPAAIESAPLPGPVVLPTVKPFPHIALLLPLQSAVFGPAADAVQRGFMAAVNSSKRTLPVEVYSDFDENTGVVPVYRQAVANGAVAVVGPLTRSGVNMLASLPDVPVPTLALNVVDGQLSPRLYFFGLEVEEEARQSAQLAKAQGLHEAIIITSGSPLSRRLQAAFEEEWNGSGSNKERGILREIEFSDDPAVFGDISTTSDTMVFLAVGADTARLIRPYLPSRLPVYATSQIFLGDSNTLTNYDLKGTRFLDMPWLLQPDHPAVMVYPRPSPALPIERERLYALGIDSFRLVQLLIAGSPASGLPLDGVTGQITLRGQTFERAGVPAVLSQGRAEPLDLLAAPPTQAVPSDASAKP